MTTGYLHRQYAQSFNQLGAPLELVRSRGWLLKRRIPDSSFHDAMGYYPLFACCYWSQLGADLDDLADELVSVSLVTDPFGGYDETALRTYFPDVSIPFKPHFVVDLSRPFDSFVSDHHQRNARNALRVISVERCERPSEYTDDWVLLYAMLVERHSIRGIAAFSKESFAAQMRVPGLTAFRAVYNGSTIGMTLWYNQGEVGYYHLGAYSPLGYQLRASFALFRQAIEYFASTGLRWLSLGAGAGVQSDEADGLTRFKRGWSTGTRMAYFCGRIFDREKYAALAQATGTTSTKYFPAYREGEFC